MILRTLRGMSPDIAHSARLAENASVIGDVRLEAFVTVWLKRSPGRLIEKL